MTAGDVSGRTARTLLEQRIWERRQTLDDFTEYVEKFAREHGERGTLSRRHLDRLVSGRGIDGKPLGRPRQATARLLERIFEMPIEELLTAPQNVPDIVGEHRLRELLRVSARVNGSVLGLLRDQLGGIRQVDRQLGALVAQSEVGAKIDQITRLLEHSLTPVNRSGLAALLSELQTLAGWQALDRGNVVEAWQHYERSKTAARESSNPIFEAHAAAEQAFALLDLGESAHAVELLAFARSCAARKADRVQRSWLAAAYGEALAVVGDVTASLFAFDESDALLDGESLRTEGPYVVLDSLHLTRWRGHALARFASIEAVDVLAPVLGQLDPTFSRAETGPRVDLAIAFLANGEREQSLKHALRAKNLANQIGSIRQLRRLKVLTAM